MFRTTNFFTYGFLKLAPYVSTNGISGSLKPARAITVEPPMQSAVMNSPQSTAEPLMRSAVVNSPITNLVSMRPVAIWPGLFNWDLFRERASSLWKEEKRLLLFGDKVASIATRI